MHKKNQSKSLFDKQFKYGIKKPSVGVASVVIGAFFAVNGGMVLAEAPTTGTQLTENSQLAPEKVVTEADASLSHQENSSAGSTEPSMQTSASTPSKSTSSTEEKVIVEPASKTDTAVAETVEKQVPAELNALNGAVAPVEERADSQSVEVAAQPVTAIAEVTADTAEEDKNQDGYVRIHLESIDESNKADRSLWLWGGVADESQNWPTGALSLKDAKKSSYGYYIDVKKKDNAAEIGYLVLSGTNGTKVTPDNQKISLLHKDMNEVFINKDYQDASFEPLQDENKLRINYDRADGKYDNWGVWMWGDTKTPSVEGTWPQGAEDFIKTGKYGRYIDVDLSKGLDSHLQFLLINQADKTQTKNLSFDLRGKYSQIFLRENDETVYTNPYFVASTKEVDTSKATQGTEDIQASATLQKPFNYNEAGILDITYKEPSDAKIVKITADASSIQGGKLEISPELKRITVNTNSSVAPGVYDIPITLYDDHQRSYTTTAKVTIAERKKQKGDLDWDEQVIYFMVTDRFYNGNQLNDNPKMMDYSNPSNPRGLYQGGDFKGVTKKLDYLKKLGVTAIWLTPIVENIEHDASYGSKDGSYYAYHGYWASDFEKLNPHLGTMEEYHELIDKAADLGVNIIVDVVLNHAGYGMNEDTKSKAPGAPTEEDRKRFEGMTRTGSEDKKGNDVLGSLAGLPDFKTEDKAVRDKLVAWQSDWIRKSTTAKGNKIYGFRVDTVKHVDHTTWQHFKNELVSKDSDFHLIGESWGANYKNTNGHLGNGMMDSLVDFGFKGIAKNLVTGQLQAANQELIARNKILTSSFTLGQFLSSHDEDGFKVNSDLFGSKELTEDRLKIAATMQLTAKGQPVVYYGEEVGQSGKNNWPYYGKRPDFDWKATDNNSILTHYKKVLDFRKNYSELLSRGTNETFAGTDSERWLMAKRDYQGQTAFITYNLNQQKRTITLTVSGPDTAVVDHYSGQRFKASQNEAGQWIINLDAPAITDGGTMLLTVENGSVEKAQAITIKAPDIQEGYIRMHFKKLPDGHDINQLGLWTWDDVETISNDKGGWPNGADKFAQASQDDYGYYLDVKMHPDRHGKISYLINDLRGSGTNLTENQSFEILSPSKKEVWIYEAFNEYSYEPLSQKGFIRINYKREDGNYNHLGAWLFRDVKFPSTGKFPDGTNLVNEGDYGVYLDVELKDLAKELGFLIVDETKEGDAAKKTPSDYIFTDLANHSQIFVRDNDPKIYTNTYYVDKVKLTGAEHRSTSSLVADFSNLEGLTKDAALKDLKVIDKAGQSVKFEGVELDSKNKTILIRGKFGQEGANYTITFGSASYQTRMSWELKDELYAYDGDLGAQLNESGNQATLHFWSPSADKVEVVVYDKDQQDTVVGTVAMTKGEKGVWALDLAASSLKLSDLTGYYYHCQITRGTKTVLALDPYAKSLAEWDNSKVTDTSYVAKAAFVNPSKLGPKLDFANIPRFTKREDAIIYEAHVRDFTSDQAIAPELKHQFGTFAAFAEKLDYLQKLGVTHIQLLPILSYYYVNELDKTRSAEYNSANQNYNWGYDPQSYFALTGMYSEDATNPELRIQEFKNLVNEIHKRNMGVVLDVVYNHTAKTAIFEDLEPNYYHFMTADGTPKESFGGGRLGTTHHMSRRVLVDSIKYLVNEFKVDGFRFDMMGDHDAASIEAALKEAQKLNPNIIMLGEGWRTFTGDDNKGVPAADQGWMEKTDTVAVFSDDIRNMLKSGFPNEGAAAFLTNGRQDIWKLFHTIKAQPNNFNSDDPGDVIQYIAAHDNLTLHDVIAYSLKKDPATAEQETHQRLRLGNALILTSQGTPFIHSGQEYGRTKQLLNDEYASYLGEGKDPHKSTYNSGVANHPYFIHDSYDSSDGVNHFDWAKATDTAAHPITTKTQAYTAGLIALRRSTDAFSKATKAEVDRDVTLITEPNQGSVGNSDHFIAYQTVASNGDIYAVILNADTNTRILYLPEKFRHLVNAEILVDQSRAGIEATANPTGVNIDKTNYQIKLDGLTAVVLRISKGQPAASIVDIPEIPKPTEMRVNLHQDAQTIDYKTALTLLEGAVLSGVEVAPDLSKVGLTESKVRVTFKDGSSRQVTIPIRVVETIPATKLEPAKPIQTTKPSKPVDKLQKGKLNQSTLHFEGVKVTVNGNGKFIRVQLDGKVLNQALKHLVGIGLKPVLGRSANKHYRYYAAPYMVDPRLSMMNWGMSIPGFDWTLGQPSPRWTARASYSAFTITTSTLHQVLTYSRYDAS
ncbi:pullulanase [Streptococcus sp. X16XC17]|uniref:pullulanase n=1 Tax=unclassified Streptococcus TaxID=2608887 RepID=UPI00069E913B|nr:MULTISPECIES: pullulanase [unclassified Streptococcus]TCD46706.1 pullulanase [Streptococcus sp. X16XC17]